MPGEYDVNAGLRDNALGAMVERGIYSFVNDYATNMGMTKSAAVRRLILIGAYCEVNHGNQSLPASYDGVIEFYSPPKTTKKKDMWS